MSERGATPAACPDVESVAAYVDGTVGPVERRTIEAHLATCDSCYDLVVATEQTVDAVGDRRPSTSGRPGRAWLYSAAGLIAAAAVVVLIVRPRMSQPPTPSEASLAGLVAAVGPQRLTELRLSGGFEYGPRRSELRGTSETDLRLAAAAAAAINGARSTSDAEAVHVAGIADLLRGNVEAAIRSLEEACGRAATAHCESDLGAAYFARAERSHAADDLTRASAHTRQALTLQPRQPEALFNDALILERLHRPNEAAAAWERFLNVDPGSGWAREARLHRSALGR